VTRPVGDDPAIGEVVVAVLTYKRTEDIAALLPLLVEQASQIPERTRVVVVDNDPAGSARGPVAALGLSEVTYVHEVQPGIAHGRNRALDEARGAHLLVFLDDDERPCEGWLVELLATYRTERSAGVAGVVLPAPGLVDDPWIEAGGFFVRQRHADGAEVPAAGTANLLLDLRQVERLGGIRFDAAFGMTGGSDTMFTRTLIQRGGRIVWSDRSRVVDHIRVARITRDWVLQRAFRAGNSWSRTSVALKAAGAARLLLRCRLTAAGLARMVAGSARAVVGVGTRNLRHQARGRRTLARGRGMILGAWGIVYNEYGKNQASRAA
jgi:succinoglycan biosynthesis protein ExoM